MPWHIETGHPDCGGYAVVKDSDGQLVGCHRTRADARKQLAALNIAEDIDNSNERAVSYTPTAAMRDEARRGLAWRAEYGRGGTLVGVARARDIANGRQLPLQTVQRMRSFFARHEVDKQAQGFNQGEQGYPSAGRIAWALWGGDAGYTWAKNIIADAQTRDIDELEDDDELDDELEDELENDDKHGIIVDIDGTLITYSGQPRTAVIEYVNSYDGPIFIVSGRPISQRVATRRLIDSLNIDYEAIYLNDIGGTKAHKKATAERLIRMYGIEVAIENDLATRAMYSELGIEYVIDPSLVKSFERYNHARRLLAHLLH